MSSYFSKSYINLPFFPDNAFFYYLYKYNLKNKSPLIQSVVFTKLKDNIEKYEIIEFYDENVLHEKKAEHFSTLFAVNKKIWWTTFKELINKRENH